jgi:anaerobic selenocysteine-containing dehydrogenase
VILPAPEPLTKAHYDVVLLQLALRNVANYSPPVFDPEPGVLDDWEILAKLALIFEGMGARADASVVDDLAIRSLVDASVADAASSNHGRDPDAVLAELAPRVGPERLLDFMLRAGPYELTLDDLLANPHGIDLGPLEPRLPDVLRTPSGMVELAPPELVADTRRLRAALDRTVDPHELLLIGRRQLRSNNSWMHNLAVLVKGTPRCTLHVHPDDAMRLGLANGGTAKVASRTGALLVPVEITDGIRKGVVSIPHGWGHDMPGVQLSVAGTMAAGVNSNLLADEDLFDPLSGNAVLNGIPVSVSAG